MYQLIEKLYPICRSITGEGNRKTLRILQEIIPLKIQEVPTGTKVFDWTVPKEWNIRDAYIMDSKGNKIIDFKKSNLHVLNYSMPVQKKVSYNELKEHIFTLPEKPDWIPYRTSYYKENWGFCMSHNQFMELREDEEYEVFIDSSLSDGSLTYGEYYIRGDKDDEILFSTHICHPSLCNDNLSGIAVCTYLARHLSEMKTRYSYRFLFIPGTIGSITWLAKNEDKVKNIKGGLVVACIGDGGGFTYKRSRRGISEMDRAVENVLKHSGRNYQVRDFIPYGYDERQYCSPGFNLPVGCLMRTPHGEYPEYHTSGDNLELVHPDNLKESFDILLSIIDLIENNRKYINTNPKCEPQLGRRGLYDMIGGTNRKEKELAMLWVLNMSDGERSLLDISERSGCNFDLINKVANILKEKDLLRGVEVV
ncbi:MAG TPA: DUF4910 domain-containing protein [Nitrospirae bacterium]|nr:DUF4910 domain-containing protein [Nitrospirota bacterium]